MKNHVIVLFVLIVLQSACKQIQYIPIETTKIEYRNNYIRDSIYHLDSIHIKEKGDTLIIERHRYTHKNKTIRDSIYIQDTIRVPFPVEVKKPTKNPLTNLQIFQIYCGRIFLILLFLLIWRSVKKLRA
jgi:hypothetical protein